MPDKWTFNIRPIKELLDDYVPKDGVGWIDPFAGQNSPAELRNDLNPNTDAQHHLDALAFVKCVDDSVKRFDGCLFDPPYSLRQIKESYESVGVDYNKLSDRSGAFTDVRDILAHLILPGGVVICCGWNTNGFAKIRGFILERVLVVAHGGNHHDTLVTVERKSQKLEFNDA